MKYTIITSESEGNTTGITVVSDALPRVGELISIDGLNDTSVRSVTHLIAKGLPWTGRIEVRLN